MGYGAFLVMEAVILFVYKLDKVQKYNQGIVERNGLEFSTYYSSLTITFTIMLLSMFVLGSVYFALVAGDIVAKENEDGNLRMVFARPISRLRLLLVKYAAICLYTFSFVFFVGISGYLMAVAAIGWEGGLFVMEPKMKVFAAFPDWSEGAFRLGLCATGIGLGMITLSSIAFMFSCFKIKPAAATIITLSILFAGVYARMTRTSVRGALQNEYVKTAVAKGVPERRVFVHHVLRPSAMDATSTRRPHRPCLHPPPEHARTVPNP